MGNVCELTLLDLVKPPRASLPMCFPSVDCNVGQQPVMAIYHRAAQDDAECQAESEGGSEREPCGG